MNEEQIALARRAMACKGWKWMPGMRQLAGRNLATYRIVSDDYAPSETEILMDSYSDILPDLSDPATIGCVLALVREAWGDPHASASWDYETNGPVVVACSHTSRWIFRDRQTEAEALVAALEAAP